MAPSIRRATALLLGAALATPAAAVIPLQTDAMVSGLALASTSAQTATVPTRSLPGNTTTVTTVSGTTNYIDGSALNSTVSLSKFSNSTGILLGAKVNVKDVATTISTRVSAATSGGTAAARSATANSTNWQASVSGTGFTTITSGLTNSRRNCSAATGSTACTSPAFSAASTSLPGNATAGSGTFTNSASVNAASLASYIGVGSVDLFRSATGATAITPGSRASTATAQSVYSMEGGTYQIVYDYIKFSTPSFDVNGQLTSAVLDFGPTMKNTPVTLNFSLYNIGNINSTGMNLVNVTRDDVTTPFTTDATPFTNVLQGTSQLFSVTFNPTTNGSFSENFHFNLADFVPVGAVGGRSYLTRPQDYTLNLTVMGSTIPEPATWATLIAGFTLVGVSARRRRRRTSVTA